MSSRTTDEHRAHLLSTFGYENKQTFGSGGFLFLDDFMGTDQDIARIARTSYGAGTKTVSDDAALVRRLVKDSHSSPLQNLFIRFFIRAPLYVVSQIRTHRTFQYAQTNQYSLRYSIAIEETETTAPDAWRAQSSSNKQGSGGFITEWPDDIKGSPGFERTLWKETSSIGEYLSARQKQLTELSSGVYNERLAYGVAREQARIDLPTSTYTELYFTVDLHNLLHFLSLRLDEHAQQEIREVAACLDRVVQQWVPIAHQAFLDYRLNAMALSSQEQALLGYLLTASELAPQAFLHAPPEVRSAYMAKHGITSLNERAVFVKKLRKLLGETPDVS